MSFYRWNMIKSFLVSYISSGFTEGKQNLKWSFMKRTQSSLWKMNCVLFSKRHVTGLCTNPIKHSVKSSSIKVSWVEHIIRCQSSVSVAGHGSSNRIKDPEYTFKSSPHGLRRWPLCGALLWIPVLIPLNICWKSWTSSPGERTNQTWDRSAQVRGWNYRLWATIGAWFSSDSRVYYRMLF